MYCIPDNPITILCVLYVLADASDMSERSDGYDNRFQQNTQGAKAKNSKLDLAALARKTAGDTGTQLNDVTLQ